MLHIFTYLLSGARKIDSHIYASQSVEFIPQIINNTFLYLYYFCIINMRT